MSEKKKIDKLFKEQFKDFEVSPSDAVWDRIESSLHEKKRKRRVIPIWWQLGGVAAILVLLLTIGNGIFNSSSVATPNESIIVDVDTPESIDDATNTAEDNSSVVTNPSSSNSENDSNETLNPNPFLEDANADETAAYPKQKLVKGQRVVDLKTNDDNTNNPSATNGRAKPSEENRVNGYTSPTNTVAQTFTETTPGTEQTDAVKSKSQVNAANSETTVATVDEGRSSKSETYENEDLTTPLDNELLGENSIENAIAETNTEKEKEKEYMNRWSISPNVAPVYFNTMGKGSSIGDDFVNNTKEGDINVSYGVAGSYAINDKIKIRAGINQVALGYNTDNVLVFNNGGATAVVPDGARLRNVSFDNNSNNTSILSVQSIRLASAPEIVSSQQMSSLDQRLGFLEIPLEMEYSLLNSKLGLNLIGGFSTLLLNKNEVYSVLNGERTLLGEANNLNSTSFSANFGVGLNYEVSKKLQLNIEPTFKYQLNTFNNTSGDFRPYFLGVYSGISFKF